MIYPKFIHLNVHSDYSIKDSICKIDNILKKAYKFNMPSIALTDYFNLSGIIKFYKKSLFYGIKPIFGCDIAIYYKNINSINYSTLLIINKVGYYNLIKLISIAHKNYNNFNFLYIDYNLLCKFNDGLILLYSLNYYCYNNKKFFFYNLIDVNKHILFLKKYFCENLYLQVFRLNHKNQHLYFKDVLLCSKNNNIDLVATNKILFLKKKDFYINKIHSSIYYGCKLKKINNFINYTNQYYFKSQNKMFNLFSDLSISLFNTIKISFMCNFLIKKKKIILPSFPYKYNYSSNDYLKKMVFIGLKKRMNFKNNNLLKNKYLLRINKELNIIFKLNISDYFLIVMEFVKWSKNNKIYVGPGRGSGAGSLVVFLLYISDVDPIKFGLIFERFLNLERQSMPDLDIDFCMNRRDEVFIHLEKIYGNNSLAQIVTFNTMTAKSVLRDVGRVLGYQYHFVDYLAKLIPSDVNITFKKALILENKLNNLYKSNKDIKYLIDISSKLEGVIKGIGKHAGGIIISPKLIDDFCATYYDKDTNKIITQFDKDDIKYIGLVKFDLLGLRTLTIINNTINIINNNKYFNSNFNINKISLNNKKSFDLLKKSKTIGVFQLESIGMRKLIKKLKPNNFNDIVSLLALFRPGPLQSGMVDNFINRKNGKECIYYPDKKWEHKLLIPVLKYTYGIILYQEQVMKIAQILANYSLEKADELRIAITKKNHKKMKVHKKIFKNGAILLGINGDFSLKIFSLMEKFANYGFNKSHSVSYSLLAYQTLWLKSNFTAEFLVSIMNADIDNIKKIILIINEAKQFGIKIIYPNINLSLYNFYVNKNKEIIYGLGAIKGIGKSSIEHIINIRNKYGLFKDYVNFCKLIYNKKITKLVLEKLIFSGSLDIFKINRCILFNYVKKILYIFKNKNNNLNFIQLSLFKNKKSLDNFIYKDMKKCSNLLNKENILNKEKESLGFYLTDHPINKYINFVKNKVNFFFIKDLFFLKTNNLINIFGLITNIKFILTKNKNNICILNLDDNTNNIDVLIFKNIYIKYSSIIDIYNIIFLSGYLKYDNNNYNNIFLCNTIKLIKK